MIDVVSLALSKNYTDKEITKAATSLKFKQQIVESLPSSGEIHTIYFIKNNSSWKDNYYDEYLWISDTNSFEKIGSTEIPEFPTSLPNPNAITFTGAVEETYDGSEPKTINIPDGGSGTDSNAVHYTEDSDKTNEEKAQARTNIGAASVDELGTKIDSSDVIEMEIATSASVVSDNISDEKLITPAAAQKLIDRLLMPIIKISTEYNVDGANEWVAGSTVNVKGDFVTKSGILYICIKDSPAGTWANVSKNYTAVNLNEAFTYDPSKTYNIGNKCVYSKTPYDQKLYVCIVDGTSGKFNAANWKDVGYAFSVDEAVDFRNYVDCFSYGLGRIDVSGNLAHQFNFDEKLATVGFRRNNYTETDLYLIFYNKNNGTVSKIRYSPMRYVTE